MRAPSSVESGIRPSFSVPVAQQLGACVLPSSDEAREACFLEASVDLWSTEAELEHAILVMVTGVRPQVDLALAAAILRAEFDIGPEDISIRAFYPEDFLVLYRDLETREQMIQAGRASSTWFELSLRPWLPQAQATVVSLPLLVPLSLCGIPGHAWSQRTASVILKGAGFLAGVDEQTARRHDMSDFRVWLRTDDLWRLSGHRLLFVEEPSRTFWVRWLGQCLLHACRNC